MPLSCASWLVSESGKYEGLHIAARCRATSARCLVVSRPAFPRDTGMLHRWAACRLPDAARTVPGCLARCRASSARCCAPPCRIRFIQRPSELRGAADPAQLRTIYLLHIKMNQQNLLEKIRNSQSRLDIHYAKTDKPLRVLSILYQPSKTAPTKHRPLKERTVSVWSTN